MSFWDHMFDNDWKQREDIEQLRRSSKTASRRQRRDVSGNSSKLESLESRVEELEADLGHTVLLLTGTLEMLKQSGTWDSDKFAQLLHEIDMRDGVEDGQASLKKPEVPE
ncbi:MAG: hypothetical protein COA78_25000 [Blastopirellula sp.]|nr:MAG: hypothetical protein COA78_25000 [Blastopirellula sp.]